MIIVKMMKEMTVWMMTALMMKDGDGNDSENEDYGDNDVENDDDDQDNDNLHQPKAERQLTWEMVLQQVRAHDKSSRQQWPP